MKFPAVRMRRLRRTENLRALVQETQLDHKQLVMPYFVEEGIKGKTVISSMPGQFRFSPDSLLKELDDLARSGVRHILLFGIPKKKDEKATQAYHEKGVVQETIRRIKKRFPDLTVISDVCLCEYMSHGHCGVVIEPDRLKNNAVPNSDRIGGGIVKGKKVMNDASLILLARTAASHAEAGADVVAPSDMMDGRVAAIRQKLDEAGFHEIPILSYAAKFASAFYSPFRDAVKSTPKFGDRKGYQMDPPNQEEAMREIELDIEEGADIVMIKPALPYLDVIQEAKRRFQVPIAAYHVSGEYSMIKAAASAGYLDEKSAVLESLLAIRRAGARILITYFAKEAACWLREE